MDSSAPQPTLTDQLFADGLEAYSIPEGAIGVTTPMGTEGRKGFVVRALQQELKRRGINIPVGPETELDNPERLLLLNRFSVQLVTAGILSDRIRIPLTHWDEAAKAPQLVAAGLVDEENDVVYFPGVMTAEQFIRQAADGGDQEVITVDTSSFEGGLERLLTYVLLLSPEALPRLSLSRQRQDEPRLDINLREVFGGFLDEALSTLWGASLQPASAAAFRSGSSSAVEDGEKEGDVLCIPIGLGGEGLLIGEDAVNSIERFELRISRHKASDKGETLQVAIAPALDGDLLPDQLVLQVAQTGYSQRQEADGSTGLMIIHKLESGIIEIKVGYRGADPFVLPLTWSA